MIGNRFLDRVIDKLFALSLFSVVACVVTLCLGLDSVTKFFAVLFVLSGLSMLTCIGIVVWRNS